MEGNGKLLYARDPQARKSASGGAFYAIARAFLQEMDGAVVYGCGLDAQNVARHMAVTEEAGLSALQGSKYVQSQMGNCFRQAAEDLKQGRAVLFSGTPCQVAGLKKFLGKPWQQLYTVDILCHGVPSPAFFAAYIRHLEKEHGGKVENLTFRNPGPTDRHGYVLKYQVNGKLFRRFAWEDPYYSAFLASRSLRPSCYSCLFPGSQHSSDLTLGDSNDQAFHPADAISLVQIHSEKGERLMQQVRHCDTVQASLAREAETNRQLTQPARKPESRDGFYDRLQEGGIRAITIPVGPVHRVKTRIKYRIPTKWKLGIKKRIRR